jgi:hypothetical protein
MQQRVELYPLLNKEPRHEDVCGSGGVTPRVLGLSSRWRCYQLHVQPALFQVNPPKSNPGRPSRGEGNVLERQAVLRSTDAKVREASCWRLHGTEVVTVSQTIPSGHRRMYAFHPHGALLVVTNSPVLVALILTTRNLQGNICEGFSSIQISSLRFTIIMEPCDHDETPLWKTLYFATDTGTHKRSENGRSAWVTLRAHPIYTDTLRKGLLVPTAHRVGAPEPV